ncbi:cytochrome c oxidase subunit 3/cytochrome o ubiquinol oxidase subunit 3 [Granulicella arctica]|uniref:Cytochrome c oxidase subunit 3/cytochrome o ubiquinol oxidase subunit 3 n=1 Tax=Granulicella arctica TaxID=940613 RepID=A0A7Y9PHZ9_9BACT|nr:cytochrome c oxidase subunit 3/cytochrome o ubiquinol oxidase subunit 3 [Granulicella arctica]
MAEAAIFIIFFVSYIFYLGKSLTGPTPAQVLELPIFGTVCLLSSSITVHWAVSALRKNNVRNCALGLASTVLLGALFMVSTAQEWYHLIYDEGLTIRTNLFGTTYYALVGLHASHVIIGLVMLSIALVATLSGRMKELHTERLEVLSLYWHFVDAIWVVVFLIVYVIGR